MLVRRGIPALLAMVLLSLVVWLGQPDSPAPLGESLRHTLETAGPDEILTVWVHFRDRDLDETALEQALALATEELPARTLKRRAKVFPSGMPLVDARDLPVSNEYLQQIVATGATLRRTSRWLNAASFEVPAGRIDQITRLDFVRRVDRVVRVVRAAIPTPVVDTAPHPVPGEKSTAWILDYGESQAGMEQANVPPVHEMGYTGQGVVVGMLDTGFHTGHESLVDVPVLGTYDFVNDDPVVDLEAGDPDNAISHGTVTLSNVAGYAPGQMIAPAYGASVLLAKTEDVADEYALEEDYWVAGLEWLEAQGADLVSASLGYYDWYTFDDLDGETAVTTIAADLAAGRGLLLVTAAGNERGSGWGAIIAPADADSVLSVGAVYADSTVTYFSSPGPTADGRIKPEVAALGYQNRAADPSDDTNYINASGTSLACPVVAGVAALVLERTPELTPMQLREALMMTAGQADSPDNDLGWGIVNAMDAVMYFGPHFVHAPLAETTTDTEGPYTILAMITDVEAVQDAWVTYRTNDGPWQQLAMTPLGSNLYSADIPGQPYTTIVDYLIEAVSVNGVAKRNPDPIDAEPFHTFAVTRSSDVECLCNQDLPEPTALLGAAPNPFNPRTNIRFRIGAAGRALLEIYDMRGRRVRSLLDENLEVGQQDVMWDGRNESGLEVGSGVYLYRLQAVDQALTGKVMLVR